MGSKSKSKNNQKQQQNKQKKGPKQIMGSDNNRMQNESDITTPQTSDLSDSAFNYEVERNWSVIFTDDNYSTDHDIRSNYSSSSEGSEADGAHSVISETESEGGVVLSHAPSNKRRDTASTLKAVQEETGGDSISTLKEGSNSVDGSFSFPDPIKNSKIDTEKNIEKTKKKETKSNKESSLKSTFPFQKIHLAYGACVIIYLLSIHLMVRLGTGSSILGILRSSLNENPRHDDDLNTLTIIRYTTKTETLYLPGKTITVEKTVPYETVVPQNQENYGGDGESVGRSSSWELSNELLSNIKDDLGTAFESLELNAINLFKVASQNAFEVSQELQDYDYYAAMKVFEGKIKEQMDDLVDSYPKVLKTLKENSDALSNELGLDEYYTSTKNVLNEGIRSLNKFSKQAYTTLGSSFDHDYFKEEQRTKALNELKSSLNITAQYISESGHDLWIFSKNSYFEFTKPNGSLDDIKDSVNIYYNLFQNKLNISKDNAHILFQKGMANANDSFWFLRSEAIKLWGNVDEKNKDLVRSPLKRASKSSREIWTSFKNYLTKLQNEEYLPPTKGKRGDSLPGFKQLIGKSRKSSSNSCGDDKYGRFWSNHCSKSSSASNWFRQKH